MKRAGGWLVEKASRVKRRTSADGTTAGGPLLELEVLALGVWGKRALWRALAAAEERGDPRFRELDLARLIRRAERQHERIEERRLQAAAALHTAG